MRRVIVITLAAFLVLGAADHPSPRPRTDGIVLLNLTLVNGTVRLDSIAVADGKLKRPKKLTLIEDQVHFEVVSAEGKSLFEGVMADPSRIRYEYVDEQGSLQTKWVVQDSVAFVVRVPYDAAIRQAQFRKITAAPPARGLTRELGPSLGSVVIELEERTDEE